MYEIFLLETTFTVSFNKFIESNKHWCSIIFYCSFVYEISFTEVVTSCFAEQTIEYNSNQSNFYNFYVGLSEKRCILQMCIINTKDEYVGVRN